MGSTTVSARVVASDQARQAAQELKQLVDGNLSTSLQQVRALGQTLSNPQVWESRLAQEFRSSQWPGVRNAIEAQIQQLDKLGGVAVKVIADIHHAGDDGAGGAGGESGKAEGSTLYETLGTVGEKLGLPLAVTGAADFGVLHLNTVKVLSRLKSASSGFAAARQELDAAETELEDALKSFQAASKELIAARSEIKKLADGFFDTLAKMGEEAGEDSGKFMQMLSNASGALKWAGRSIGGLAIVGDVLTIINPGKDIQGGLRTAVRVEAGVNLAATGTVLVAGTAVGGEALAAAGLSWVPVVGQVLAVGTALVIAYQTIKPFHDFVNGVGHDVANVAKDAWNGMKSAGKSVAHFFGF
jgi:hypothetical protein